MDIMANLPGELFTDIIDHLILSIGIYKAFRLRTVSKLFNETILHEIFDRGLIDFFDLVHERARWMSAPLMARLLLAQTKLNPEGNKILSTICRAVQMLEENSQRMDELHLRRSCNKESQTNEQQRFENIKADTNLAHTPDYCEADRTGEQRLENTTRVVCEAMARHMSPYHLIDFLKLQDRGSFSEADDNTLALSAAIIVGNITIVRTLLAKSDLNAESPCFGTPLKLAATCGHLEIVQLLLDYGADVLRGYKEDGQQLHNIRTFRSSDGSVLRTACLGGHGQIVSLLLQHGIPTSGIEYENCILAATRGGHVDLVTFLIEKTGQPSTPLLNLIFWEASYYGRPVIVERMLRAGVDVNIQREDSRNRTALQLATIHGHDKVMRLLLDSGADDLANGYLGNALTISVSHGQEKAVQLLLEYGFDINGKPKKKNITILVATKHCQVHMLRFLLRNGADINATYGSPPSKVGEFALRLAVSRGLSPIVRVLVEAGVPLRSATQSYDLVQDALKYGRDYMLETLLELGAQNVPHSKGISPKESYVNAILMDRQTCHWVGKY